jgi:DUF1009 family protein
MIESLAIVAGVGEYPLLMAQGARKAGVKKITALAIRGAAERRLKEYVDEWVPVGIGELQRLCDWCTAHNNYNLEFGGGISPTALFTTKFDALSRKLLAELPVKNAHTIFTKLCDILEETKVKILPASYFMEDAIPGPGLITSTPPDAREMSDLKLAEKISLAISSLEIGQVVVVKDGAICAVEALEGTNTTIKRGTMIGGKGCVVFKGAKEGHDMRFDIPAFGMNTLKFLRKTGVSVFAFQAYRMIFLEQEQVRCHADKWGIKIVSLPCSLQPCPTWPE